MCIYIYIYIYICIYIYKKNKNEICRVTHQTTLQEKSRNQKETKQQVCRDGSVHAYGSGTFGAPVSRRGPGGRVGAGGRRRVPAAARRRLGQARRAEPSRIFHTGVDAVLESRIVYGYMPPGEAAGEGRLSPLARKPRARSGARPGPS